MDKILIKKIIFSVLQVVVIFFVVFGALVFFEFWQQKKDFKKGLENVVLYRGDDNFGLVKVLGESDEVREEYVGDKYVVQDITLGGEALMELSQDDKEREMLISHFQGRLYLNNDDQSLAYYVSWQSNKPILSKLMYKKEEDPRYSELSEDNHTYLHTFTIPEIDFSSVYQYKIVSRDRWGNEIESDEFVFYTGPEETSFFEMLEDAFGDVFGWTVRK